MATKRFFIKSSSDLIARELEKLQNKVNFLEATTEDKGSKKRARRTAVYSPPMEIEATKIDFEFETDDEMFSTVMVPK
jgi:hypothetical protein